MSNFEFCEYGEDMYKVIEILNEQELLINYGSYNGSYPGEKVFIIERGGIVEDPDTGEVLGTLDTIKDTLEVCMSYDKFSLCRKVNRTVIDLTSLEDETGIFTTYENINVDRSEMTYRYLPTPTKIRVGDLVKIDD